MIKVRNSIFILAGTAILTFLVFYIFSGDKETSLLIATILFIGASGYTAYKQFTGDINVFFQASNARELLNNDPFYVMVQELAQKAGLNKPIRVGIADNSSVNAFALSLNGENAIVITTGALAAFAPEEGEAVIAHEIGHIKSGDSIAKNSIVNAMQGIMYIVLLPFYVIYFFAVLFAPSLQSVLSWIMKAFETAVQYTFAIIGTVSLNAFSRQREFAADKFSAELTSLEQAVLAIEKLNIYSPDTTEDTLISVISGSKFTATHPTNQERVNALLGVNPTPTFNEDDPRNNSEF